MTRALAQATGVDEAVLAHRLMGDWKPSRIGFETLIGAHDPEADASKPYPFALASPVEEVAALGDPADWLAEWKWDGIRGQLVNRAGAFALWSRGEELVTDRFPDLAPLRDFLPPGLVIDAEVLAWGARVPCPSPRSRSGSAA